MCRVRIFKNTPSFFSRVSHGAASSYVAKIFNLLLRMFNSILLYTVNIFN